MRFGTSLCLCIALCAFLLDCGSDSVAPTETEEDSYGSLSGSVRFGNGEPYAWCALELEGTNQRAFTNSAGEFRFENLIPGRYRLLYDENWLDLEIAAEEKIWLCSLVVDWATPDVHCRHDILVVEAGEDRVVRRQKPLPELGDNTYFTDADSMELVITPLMEIDHERCRNLFIEPPRTPCDSAIDTLGYFVVTLRNDTIYSGTQDKQTMRDIRVRFATTGNDTLIVLPKLCLERTIILLGSAQAESGNQVRIFSEHVATGSQCDESAG